MTDTAPVRFKKIVALDAMIVQWAQGIVDKCLARGFHPLRFLVFSTWFTIIAETLYLIGSIIAQFYVHAPDPKHLWLYVVEDSFFCIADIILWLPVLQQYRGVIKQTENGQIGNAAIFTHLSPLGVALRIGYVLWMIVPACVTLPYVLYGIIQSFNHVIGVESQLLTLHPLFDTLANLCATPVILGLMCVYPPRTKTKTKT